MLEPCALKGARTVLRGLGDGNIPWLLDYSPFQNDRNNRCIDRKTFII